MGASQKLRTANIRNPLFNYCIKNPPFASLRMAKLHCLTSMLGLCGSPNKTNQQTQTFTKESVVFFSPVLRFPNIQFFIFGAVWIKEILAGPHQNMLQKGQVFKWSSTGVFGSSKWWEFPCRFPGASGFFEYAGQTPPVCGWKVMISIGPIQ